MWQANHIADALRALGHEVSIEIIRTTGDRMQNIAFASVGAKGMFTREIEEALLAGTIDLAVHSLKDLPTELGEPFTLAAIPRRADPRDVLVSEQYAGFDALPAGAVVGTSSLRRQAQLRARRADLEYVEFRGNVDTRLSKLAAGQSRCDYPGCGRPGSFAENRRNPRAICARSIVPRSRAGCVGHRVQGRGWCYARCFAATGGSGYPPGHHGGAQMSGGPGRRMPGSHRRLLPPYRRRIVTPCRSGFAGWPADDLCFNARTPIRRPWGRSSHGSC